MDKCPVCGADTRPGDNYCLNCGQRLLPSTPPSPSSPQQAQPDMGDATLAAPEDWGAAASGTVADWGDPGMMASSEQPTLRESIAAPTAQATAERIEKSAKFILRSDTGEQLQEYPLDKYEIVIGRAPNSDILLSKDKLTSRRHATVRFENGQYLLYDDHSANGTFVNGQQIEDTMPHLLQEGNVVGIGEHELVFRVYGSSASNYEEMPTIAAPFGVVPQDFTYRTRDDVLATIPGNDEFGTKSMENASYEAPAQVSAVVPPVSPPPLVVEPEPEVEAEPEVEVEPVVEPTAYAAISYPSAEEPVVEKTTFAPVPGAATYVAPAVVAESPVVSKQTDTGSSMNFNRLTTLSQPTLPDMSALMAALSTLDGQVMSLQEQMNSVQESMRSHDADVAQTANQLRTGIRRVSDRMDNTIADVARSREALAWAELSQLMEDVMNNPRDIEYVTKLARKARELNKVFQLHQSVLNTMAECNSLLRSMMGEESQ